MKGFGLFVLVVSLALGAYAFAIYDPSVGTGYGSVYNIGKLQNRQNMLIIAAVGAAIGTLFFLFAKPIARDPTQEQFASMIKTGNLAAMAQLLESGAIDPNGRAPGSMQTWLNFAVRHEGAPQCELLLRKGADPALPDGLGTKPVDYARRLKRGSSVQENIHALLENPPQQDAPAARKDGESPPLAAETAARSHSIADELAELARLREAGSLTTDEFERAKARVLA